MLIYKPAELVLINPNSFKNLETILKQLHENAIKNSERERERERVIVCWNRQTTILLYEMVARKEII